MNSKVVMPPPGNFSRPDLYCHKRWHQVQHIANEFWSHWRKEFLQYLQTCNRWQSGKSYVTVTFAQLCYCQNEVGQNQWITAKVTEVFKDSSGYVWNIKLKVGKANMSDQKQHHIRKTCNKNSFTLQKRIVFDSPTLEPVISRQFKITWLSWGSHVLVLCDVEHPKRNMELSALIKIYYYIYVLTKKRDICLLFSKKI